MKRQVLHTGFWATRLSLHVSLDGATAATNDAVRGKGSFERILAGIRNLVEAGFAPTISTVITRQNAEQMKDMVRLVKDLGARNWHLLWIHKKGAWPPSMAPSSRPRRSTPPARGRGGGGAAGRDDRQPQVLPPARERRRGDARRPRRRGCREPVRLLGRARLPKRGYGAVRAARARALAAGEPRRPAAGRRRREAHAGAHRRGHCVWSPDGCGNR